MPPPPPLPVVGCTVRGRVLVLLATVMLVLLVSGYLAVKAYADGDEDEYKNGEEEYEGKYGDEYEGEEEEEDEYEANESLGSIGFYGGVLATLVYVAPKYARQLLGLRLPPRVYRYTLDLHAAGNMAAAVAALTHGYLNIRYATPLEYAMAVLIVLLVVTGLVMRYAENRKAKLVARLVHGQRVFALTLLVLALLHQALMED